MTEKTPGNHEARILAALQALRDGVLSTRDIAEALNMSRNTLRRWGREAGIPAKPVGRPRETCHHVAPSPPEMA